MISKRQYVNDKDTVSWSGQIISIQPRIRLTRSFDQIAHTYLGFILQLQGILSKKESLFSVAIGKATQEKYHFCAGNIISGNAHPVHDPRTEVSDLYKTCKLKLIEYRCFSEQSPPPWLGIPPELKIYRERGHRRLYARTYEAKCRTCIWGCRMPVEIIIDHWNPWRKKYRFETFCYGPKSCIFYKAGPIRKVPGRRGMIWEEEDWIDEEATSHRDDND